jgi:acetyltransferase
MDSRHPEEAAQRLSRRTHSADPGFFNSFTHPEDEQLLHDLAADMSPEDLRLRFFTAVRGLTQAVAARLSQLDYDRELALLAQCAGTTLGVVYFFADPDNRRAEYAIAVRSDWQGRALGYLLMNRISTLRYGAASANCSGSIARERADSADVPRIWFYYCFPTHSDPG